MNQQDSLLSSALISFEWVFHCKHSSNHYISDEVSKYEKLKRCSLINAGTLMSFAYVALVFPSESKMLETLSVDKLDYSKFSLVNDLDEKNSMDDISNFLRRIRNAISHANFRIDDENIILHDGPSEKNINFRISISTEDYGDFLNSILSLWNESLISETNKNG